MTTNGGRERRLNILFQIKLINIEFRTRNTLSAFSGRKGGRREDTERMAAVSGHAVWQEGSVQRARARVCAYRKDRKCENHAEVSGDHQRGTGGGSETLICFEKSAESAETGLGASRSAAAL